MAPPRPLMKKWAIDRPEALPIARPVAVATGAGNIDQRYSHHPDFGRLRSLGPVADPHLHVLTGL